LAAGHLGARTPCRQGPDPCGAVVRNQPPAVSRLPAAPLCGSLRSALTRPSPTADAPSMPALLHRLSGYPDPLLHGAIHGR
jgi:hypothetical protein